MQQHPRALDMAQEPVANADALMRALDEARDIGNDEFAAIDGGNAEVRRQRGERIVGDLWLGGGDAGEKRRFARIGQSDDPGVRDERSQITRSAPSRPGLAWRGAWFTGPLK
jgi:hypothetical protein